jgi:hypothetical protein
MRSSCWASLRSKSFTRLSTAIATDREGENSRDDVDFDVEPRPSLAFGGVERERPATLSRGQIRLDPRGGVPNRCRKALGPINTICSYRDFVIATPS